MMNPDFYLRKRELDEVLTWDHVDIGVTKSFFKKEYEKAQKGQTTPNCREKCAGCGAAQFGTGVCYE